MEKICPHSDNVDKFIRYISRFHLPRRCFWWGASCLVNRFIGVDNDSNSNIQWSQDSICVKKQRKKVSNNKAFARTNLVTYKLHNANSIPKQFIRNYVRHQMWHKHDTLAGQYLSQNKAIHWLIPVTTNCCYSLQWFRTATARCACTPWNECEESYSRSLARSRVNSNQNRWREALLST